MNQKKIVMILGSMHRGGAERVISILSQDYAEKGWSVDVILLLFNNVEYILHPKVNVIDMAYDERKSRIARVPKWLYGIRKYIKDSKPDVVLSFAARINILVKIACIGMKQRLFVSERNDPRCDGRSKLVDLLTKVLYPKTSACIFQTRRAASYFPNLNNKVIIANPIMIFDIADKIKEHKIVAAGRLSAQKNQKLLIEAFSEISTRYPMYTLEIYGDGELLEELIQCAKDHGVEEKTVFHGNVFDLHKQIANAEIFVLSSDFEGLSNALLEAMMMGLPCISTNCAGSDEYIESEKNGLLVPVGNVEEMASALERLIKDEKLRIKLGEQAKMDSDIFSKDAILHKWHSLMD